MSRENVKFVYLAIYQAISDCVYENHFIILNNCLLIHQNLYCFFKCCALFYIVYIIYKGLSIYNIL